MRHEFISEDDLKTFEGWMKYQAVDPVAVSSEELAQWQQMFTEATQRAAATPKVGLMRLQPVVGEYRYAVALEEGGDLWLTLWVRRSRKGEFFIMLPHGDRDWDGHTSYHLDGSLHVKSFGRKVLPPQKRQPLTGTLRGVEHLGLYAGAGFKSVGAVCRPADFDGVVKVPPGVLGPRNGWVAVDLVEPGHENDIVKLPDQRIERHEVFRDCEPWVVIRVASA